MNSVIFLTIKDPTIKRGFDAQRKRQVNFSSCFILILRSIQLIYRVFGYTTIKECVLSYYFILFGIGVHILSLLLSIKWVWASKIHSAIIILSYMNIQFCLKDSFSQGDHVAFLIDIIISDYAAAIFLNQIWILTILASLITRIVTYNFYVHLLDYPYQELIYPLLLSWCIQIIIIYMCEKLYKTMYIQMKENENLKEQFKKVLEQLPDGVLIYQKDTKQLLLSNSEFKKMMVSCTNTKIQFKDEFSMPIFEPYFLQDNTDINCQDQDQAFASATFNFTSKETLGHILENYEEGQCFKVCSHKIDSSDFLVKPQELIEGDLSEHKVVTINKSNLNFLNNDSVLLVFKNLTETVKCHKVQIENQFYELLTATVSHEMRTPLNAIITLLSNFEVYLQNNPEAIQIFNIIKHSAKMLNYLVHDMLDLFQIKNGKLKKNLSVVKARDIFVQVIEMYKMQADYKNIEIIYVIDPSLPEELFLDENRCKQVLINLMTNAMKFTFKGFIKLIVSYDEKCNLLKVKVQDTGIGISQKDQQKLFRLFGKLQSTQSVNTSGIGLGLSICKTIVESFEGQIQVESAKEKGSTFTFTFEAYKGPIQSLTESQIDEALKPLEVTFEIPANEESIASQFRIDTSDIFLKGKHNFEEYISSAYQSMDENSYLDCDLRTLHKKHLSFGKKREEVSIAPCKMLPKVLVVDDNSFNVFTLQMLLRATFEVQSDKAMNGKEAIDKLLQREQQLIEECTCIIPCVSYDIIFMDCNMPVMDGFQASEAIHKLYKDKQIRHKPTIVALTAYESKEFEKKSLSHKMDKYLTKPVEAKEIENLLKQHSLLKYY